MIESLQLIKPKRLSEDLNVFIKDSTYIIDFGTSIVMLDSKGGEKSPPCVISTKEIFNDNFEAANVIASIGEFELPKVWHNVVLNATDVNLFNSIASAGEDLFWFGRLTMNDKRFKVQTAGLIYFVDFLSPKLDLPTITAPLDYNFYYYMYQMFKSVTGKKLATMKIGLTDDTLVVTDENDTFYIATRLHHQEFMFKVIGATQIAIEFVNATYGNETKTTRKACMAGSDSILKHLSKFLGEDFSVAESSGWMKYYNMYGGLYLGKKKVKDGA